MEWNHVYSYQEEIKTIDMETMCLQKNNKCNYKQIYR